MTKVCSRLCHFGKRLASLEKVSASENVPESVDSLDRVISSLYTYPELETASLKEVPASVHTLEKEVQTDGEEVETLFWIIHRQLYISSFVIFYYYNPNTHFSSIVLWHSSY